MFSFLFPERASVHCALALMSLVTHHSWINNDLSWVQQQLQLDQCLETQGWVWPEPRPLSEATLGYSGQLVYFQIANLRQPAKSQEDRWR